MNAPRSVHIYFVLDRSGSMGSIRDDVVGGFNGFVQEQQAQPGNCRMTLVQFDTGDPYEVLLDARPISEVAPLTASDFRPRGGTPLFDAMGHTIANATIRAEQRSAAGEDPEQILFVTFTDGQENQSVEYDREKIFAAIKTREERGWSFVYLGANQDAYVEGGSIGYSRGSTSCFRADRIGTAAAFGSLSRSSSSLRERVRSGAPIDSSQFFEGTKEAEDDLARRRPVSNLAAQPEPGDEST
jgi:hypothetical protein